MSFVVFVWFFSRTTSLETMYFWDSHLAISLSDSLPALHVRESKTDSRYWILILVNGTWIPDSNC